MGLLNPLLLWLGVAAVSVPIIIHLLNRRKFQRVVWGAMRFLRVAVEQNQRRMRIEDLILLMLRCLLLLLLGLALARPALKEAGIDLFNTSKVTAVLILDNSMSMGLSDGGETRWEKAKRAAEQALDTMPSGSATAVLLASDIVQGAIPEPTFDFNLARKVIREAPLTDRATDLGPAIFRAMDALKPRIAIRKEIYLITDGQALGWRQFGEIQKTFEREKTAIRSHVLFVNEHEERNLGVSGLRCSSGLTPVKQPLRFEVRVANYGRDPVRDLRVTLAVDNEPPSDEFTIDSIAPGSTRNVALFARLKEEGFHSITARIPDDRLPADDKRALVLRVIKEVRVLLVDGDLGEEPRAAETFFLRNALVPVSATEAPNYFIKPTRITPAELPGARLDDFDAVILANVSSVPESVATGFESYLRRGGGLIIFPGAKVNADAYNDTLSRKHDFLPATLGEARGEAESEEKFFTLADKGLDHSIVTLWNDPAAGSLATPRFFRAFELRPAAWKKPDPNAKDTRPQEAGEPQVVLRYTDGQPAVMERTWGLGRVILFSSTADTGWNDLPVRPLFVPLVHRALGACVQRQDEGLNIAVGQKFTRQVSTELLGKDARYFKPRQTDALLDVRRVDLVAGVPMLQYDRTDLGGVYEVKVGEPPAVLKFAAQPEAIESSLEELSPELKKQLATSAHVVEWAPNTSLKDSVQIARSGAELWLPFALAALLIAMVETFLAQWFSRSK